MQKSKFDLVELNKTFFIDNYISLDDNGRIDFRIALKNCITALQKHYKLKMMTKDDLVIAGMRKGNRTALAIEILTEKLVTSNYDQAFQFRDTLAILRKQLLEELYGGKDIFYDLGERTLGLDSNFVPFILGEKFKLIK